MASLSSRRRLSRLAGWPLITALSLTAFALGFIGFHTALGDERSALDIAYLSLQLFTVESGNVAGPNPPLALEIARFLAPMATAYVLGAALIRIFSEQIDQWRLRRSRDHVVVIGLGWLGMGLVERLVDHDMSIVAVSLGMNEEAVASISRLKVPVVTGDARDPRVLKDARVGHADHVVVLAGDDETNTEVALAARTAFKESDGESLTCLTHIREPRLAAMLRSEALADHTADGFRLEIFDIADEAAAMMLDEHAAEITSRDDGRLGVIGDNDVAAAIIVEAARTRRFRSLPPVDVVLAGPDDVLERLHTGYPLLRTGARTKLVGGPPVPLEDRSYADLASCDIVFVCLDNDAEALATSLDVAAHIPTTPVVIAVGAWTGFTGMLASSGSAGSLHPFPILDRVLAADLLLAGVGERLAKAIHETYVEQRLKDGADPDDPSIAPWRDLSPGFRQSNRAQAAHLGVKLHAIGAGLAPLTQWDDPPGELTDEEVDILARLEHERFVEERLAAGWTKGERDADAHTSPYLVPWDDLTGVDGERVRDLDRAAVRAIPALLTRAGYRLVRG